MSQETWDRLFLTVVTVGMAVILVAVGIGLGAGLNQYLLDGQARAQEWACER